MSEYNVLSIGCKRLIILRAWVTFMCWAVLSFNSRVTLNFFVLKLPTSELSKKNLRLDCHLSTYLVFKLYCIHTRDCSQFQCKFKTRKSRGLPLSCSTSTQQLGTQMSVWCQNYEVPEKMDTVCNVVCTKSTTFFLSWCTVDETKLMIKLFNWIMNIKVSILEVCIYIHSCILYSA